MRITTFLIACTLSMSLASCAFVGSDITLDYKKQPNVQKIEGAENINVAVQINDSRTDKSKVSAKKNGLSIETASIKATEDVSVTIKNAITEELKSRGFNVGDRANVSIVADLTRFYSDHQVGLATADAVANLDMKVKVTSQKDETKYFRLIEAEGIEANNLMMNGGNAKLALEKALANAMDILFKDQQFLAALKVK